MLYTSIMRFKQNLTQEEHELALAQRDMGNIGFPPRILR